MSNVASVTLMESLSVCSKLCKYIGSAKVTMRAHNASRNLSERVPCFGSPLILHVRIRTLARSGYSLM